MKRFFFFLLALCLIIPGGFFGGRYWLESSYLPSLIEETKVEGSVLRATPQVGIFPPQVVLSEVNWTGQIASFDVNATARRVVIAPNLWALCKGSLEITQLEILQPVLHIREMAESSAGTRASVAMPQIGRLHLQGGQIRFGEARGEWVLEEVQAIVRNLGPKQEASLECDAGAALYGSNGQSVIKGNFALKSLMRYYAPNLIFRDTASTFTITHPALAARLTPCRVQLAGAFNLKSGQFRLGNTTFASPIGTARLSGVTTEGKQEFAGKITLGQGASDNGQENTGFMLESAFTAGPRMIVLKGAALSFGNIQAMGNLAVNLDNPQKLAQFEGEMAGGSLTAGLAWSGKGFDLKAGGEKISLGEILTQAGLPGLSGGASGFEADFHFGGSEAGAMRKSLAGGGAWLTEQLVLEPFGELRLLLPLLGGASRAVPEKIERLELVLNADNGILKFRPIKAVGPNFTGQGMLDWNLADHRVKGAIVLKTPGLQIPVALSGTWGHLGISIDPELLKGLPR